MSEELKAKFAPCPTCGQYSHSIGEDALTEAFNQFQAMFSHRGDGIPTMHCFDANTRDAAQVLMAAARTPSPREAELEAENARLREALEAEDDYWRASRVLAASLPRLRENARAVFAAAAERRDIARAAIEPRT